MPKNRKNEEFLDEEVSRRTSNNLGGILQKHLTKNVKYLLSTFFYSIVSATRTAVKLTPSLKVAQRHSLQRSLLLSFSLSLLALSKTMHLLVKADFLKACDAPRLLK